MAHLKNPASGIGCIAELASILDPDRKRFFAEDMTPGGYGIEVPTCHGDVTLTVPKRPEDRPAGAIQDHLRPDSPLEKRCSYIRALLVRGESPLAEAVSDEAAKQSLAAAVADGWREVASTMRILTIVVASLAVALVVARWFAAPIQRILAQIVDTEITYAWTMYLRFAILVVGISSGVRIFQLERYISPEYGPEPGRILELTRDRWVLEIYRTVIGTMQGIAWVLLVFFVVALLALVIVRLGEARASRRATPSG